MINVSVHYPRNEGAHFDKEYYFSTHIPMVERRYGAALKASTVLDAVFGADPDMASPHVASAHFVFDSIDDFTEAFTRHGDELVGDIAQFTDIEPVLEVSEIKYRSTTDSAN
ncbi:UNVERIFIED_ORG: uncharacterized protein (TIGR02118 family) [Gordonia westfalica J30]